MSPEDAPANLYILQTKSNKMMILSIGIMPLNACDKLAFDVTCIKQSTFTWEVAHSYTATKVVARMSVIDDIKIDPTYIQVTTCSHEAASSTSGLKVFLD
jgi:hypothetical protein